MEFKSRPCEPPKGPTNRGIICISKRRVPGPRSLVAERAAALANANGLALLRANANAAALSGLG